MKKFDAEILFGMNSHEQKIKIRISYFYNKDIVMVPGS